MEILRRLKEHKDKRLIASFVEEAFDDLKDLSFQMMQRIWWRNLLYYCGEQWIEYIRSQNTFRRRQISDFVPTPVSNEIREYVRANKAMLLNQKLVPKVWPNTNEKQDEDAAELGSKLLTWMDYTNDGEFVDEKEKVCVWVVLAGTTFMRTFPNMEGGQWGMTKDGILKTGDVGVESINPFQVRLDPLGDTLRKKRWIGIQSLKPKEWVEDTFKVKIDGTDNASSIDYQKRLMRLVGQVSPWKGYGLETTATEFEDDSMVLFREMEFRPTNEKPQGRYLVTCRDKVLIDLDRMPIKAEKESWYYSLTDFHWNYVPGRFWSDSGVDDLISSQNGINEIDQMLALNRKGLGRPMVVTPGELNLKRVNEGGQGILQIQYDPILASGKEPAFRQGIPLTAQIMEERMLHKQQIQDSSGDPKNILKGQAPSASDSGIKVDILRETAERSHYPDTDRFNRSLGRVYKKRLILAQEIITEERMMKVSGKGNRINVIAFKGSDLRDNTDVRLELDSGLANTKAGQRQILMNLAEKGFLGDVINNSELRRDLLQRFGMSGFAEQENVDMDRAEKENGAISLGQFDGIFLVDTENVPEGGSVLDAGVLVDDPYFKYDNHEVHFEIHRRQILSPEFKEWPLRNQTVLIHHTDITNAVLQANKQAMMMQEQEAAMAQEAMEKGPPGPNSGDQESMADS